MKHFEEPVQPDWTITGYNVILVFFFFGLTFSRGKRKSKKKKKREAFARIKSVALVTSGTSS